MASALDYAAEAAQRASVKKGYLKGATADQKTAINYMIPATGCAGLFGGVKDADYDAVVDNLVKNSDSYNKALNKIGLDEDELKEIPPVTLYGYEDGKNAITKVGYDGSFRSSLYSITHIFFSSTQVYMYQIILNTMTNEKKERTEEYFYKDITNFSTSSETVESWRYGKGCNGKLTKVNVETQQFALIVPGDKFTCATYGDIDSQVKAMKNKLREKKL